MRLLSSSKFRPAVVLIMALVLCPCVFIAGVSYDIGPFGHDQMFVPNYTDAQQVQVFTGAQIPTPVPPTDPNMHYIGRDDKMVTFVTADTPQGVLTYYRDAMMRRFYEGWQLGDAKPIKNSLSMLSYSRRDSGPMYFLHVYTEQMGTRTYVTVTRELIPGL